MLISDRLIASYHSPAMHDGAGGKVSLVGAAAAVHAFAELWGNALFDCGPQDYQFMQEEILKRCVKS